MQLEHMWRTGRTGNDGTWVLGKSWELFLEATKWVGQSEGLEACHLSSCHSCIQCTVSVFLMIGIAHVKCVDLYIFLSIYGLCSDINTHTHSQTELCQDTCEDASAHTCDILWHPVTIPDLRTQTQKDAADQSMWFKHIQTSIKSITGNQPMTMDNSRITDDFPWIVPVEMAMECSWIYHVWWHRRGSGPSRPCWKHRHDIASCMAFWHLLDPLWGARHVVNDGYGSKLTENHRCWFIFRYFWKENIFFLGYYSYIILYNHFDQSPVCCCFASTQTSWRKVTLI